MDPELIQTVGYFQNREFGTGGTADQSIALMDNRLETQKQFYRKNLQGHCGCVNAIEFGNNGSLMVSGGDDRRVLLWNTQKSILGNYTPIQMDAEHGSNIFTVAIDSRNTKLFSGGNDDQVIVHDILTKKPLDVLNHDGPVYAISMDPLNDSVFATACDDGKLQVVDIRATPDTDHCVLAKAPSAFHAVMFNPVEPQYLVSANNKKGIALWDVRMPEKTVIKYGGKNPDQCCMSAKFSQNGSKIIALRRRLPPVLYAINSTNHLYQFHDSGYYNSCTMKSCTFAGSSDQYLLAGSDNFDLFMWKIPMLDEVSNPEHKLVENAHLVLRGHRSIVNQVRYNHKFGVIASCGVEKVVKLWSPFQLPNSADGLSSFGDPKDYQRKIYSNNEYINLILQSGFFSFSHEMSRRSQTEDPRMLAFFDALVQRDIEGMSDNEDLPFPEAYAGSDSSSTPSPLPRIFDSSSEEEEEIPTPDSESGTSPNILTNDETSSNQTTCGSSKNEAAPSSSKSIKENSSETVKTVDNEQNTISKMLAQRQGQLVQLARFHSRLEQEGKPKLKKRRTFLNRLKRLDKKTHYLSMSLLDSYPDSSSSSATNSVVLGRRFSNDSSSSSSDADTSSSSSESDPGTEKVAKKISTSPPVYSSSSSDEELETTVKINLKKSKLKRKKTKRTTKTETHKSESSSDSDSNAKKKEKTADSGEDSDNKPCSSAQVLSRDRLRRKKLQKSDASPHVETTRPPANQSSNESSTSSSESDTMQTFVSRLKSVSRRLSRLRDISESSFFTRSFNPKRKQKSTMMATTSSSTSSSEVDTNKPPSPKRSKLERAPASTAKLETEIPPTNAEAMDTSESDSDKDAEESVDQAQKSITMDSNSVCSTSPESSDSNSNGDGTI